MNQKERNSRMAESTSERELSRLSPDEVALELMKFIAVTTGYGRGTPTTGFGSKGHRSSEEYADSLIELYERCRSLIRKEPK